MKLKTHHLHYFLLAAAVIILFVTGLHSLASGRAYFTGSNLASVVSSLKTFGILAPIIVSVLIFLPYAIPFFPIPAQFVEIAAGLLFGFWPGAMLVWVTQMVTALITFSLSDRLEHTLAKRRLWSKPIAFFHGFMQTHAALAVCALRATMSSPVNVSYLAGMTDMSLAPFLLATALGVVPETILFTYLGSTLVAGTHLDLFPIFILVLSLTYLPSVLVALYEGKKDVVS